MATFLRAITNPCASAQIGIARRDITPPVGIYNRSWGAATHDTAEGIHRPLTVTAIAIKPVEAASHAGSVAPGSQSSTLALGLEENPALTSTGKSETKDTLILVAMDAGWWQAVEDEWFLRGAVLERFKLDPAQVMIAFAHTHSGPSICRGDADKPGGGLIAGYLESVRGNVIEAVDEAIRNVRPATLTWAYGQCNLAANRDLPEPEGNELPRSSDRVGLASCRSEQTGWKPVPQEPRIVCGYNPDNPADDTVLVGRMTEEASGRIIGTIVNYACHPTTLAWDNKLISPDYVGAMREVVERETGGVPCAFLQGSSGELAPREQYVGDAAIADRNGRWLGYAVLSTLESMLPPRTALEFAGVVESGASLATWKRVPYQPPTTIAAQMITVPLPLKPLPSEEQIEQEAAACGDRVMAERLRRKARVRKAVGTGMTYTLPTWIWRIGDAVLIGQPNETYSAFQQELRQRFSDNAVAVMNLVNGAIGYVSPAVLHDLDIYQVWQSPFDRNALDVLITACEHKLNEMIA